MRSVLVVFILVVGACEKLPVFREPPEMLGGFVVRCVGLTDFDRTPPAPLQCTELMDAPARGCACSDNDGVSLPPDDGENPTGAFAIRGRPGCTTTLADACVPNTLPTLGGFQDENPTFPQGQVQVPSKYQDDDKFTFFGSVRNLIAQAGHKRSTGGELPSSVSEDLNNAMFQACSLAHFGLLSERILGAPYHTPTWVAGVQELGEQFGQWTTVIDSHELKEWIGEDSSGTIDDLVRRNDFASKVLEPKFSPCLSDKSHPFGFEAVGIFNRAGGISNPPPNESLERKRQCPGGECVLADLDYTALVQAQRSTALITVSDSSSSDQAATDLKGNFSIKRRACELREDVLRCDVQVTDLSIMLGAFSIAREDVVLLRIHGGLVPIDGTLQGETLVLPNVSGVAEVRLADGKFANIELSTGILLGRWRPELNSFEAAFAFEGLLDESDRQARIEGTLGGVFHNTSPISHVTSQQIENGDVECTAEMTPVALSGTESLDADGDELSFRWLDESLAAVGSGPELVTVPLPLGSHERTLRVFDSKGAVGTDTLAFSVVDTTPPVTANVAAPSCIWPPSHQAVRLTLGEEIVVEAVDACDPTAPTIQIVSVRVDEPDNPNFASSNEFSFTPSDACLVVERSGKSRRVYEIDLSISDVSGNQRIETIEIEVPHDMFRSRVCARSQRLPQCSL